MYTGIYMYVSIYLYIYIYEKVSFFLNTDLYDCEKAKFCDPHHKNIIPGDLRIIENKNFVDLLAKVEITKNPEKNVLAKPTLQLNNH